MFSNAKQDLYRLYYKQLMYLPEIRFQVVLVELRFSRLRVNLWREIEFCGDSRRALCPFSGKMPVYLNYIVINNFKSFRGEITVGPIQPFTAVVGPNGAGKSNVMDAISFVMGERINNMRVKRLNELIHGASLGKPIAKSAGVTAVFVLEDGTNKSFTRIIRNAASEYKINNEVVTAKVYMLELDQLHLNVKNKNFLVFQGTVESIAIMTPKEKTEMLEEISSSSELKEEYDRLKKEMCRAEYEVQYINQKKRDLLLQKKYALMEEQEAEKYQMLKEQYMKKKAESQLFELYHIKKDIEELESNVDEKAQLVQIHKSEKKNAMNELQHTKRRLDLLSHELLNIEQALAEQEITVKNKQASFEAVKQQISYWQEKLDKATLSLTEAYTAYSAHKQCIQELENELIQIMDMRETFEATIASQGSSLELSNTQVQKYFHLKSIARGQSSEYMQLIDSLKREQNLDQNKLENENRKRVELDNILKRKGMMLSDTQKRLKKLEVYIKETENILVHKTQAKTNLQKKINENDGKSDTLQKELRNISEQLEDVKLDNHAALRLKEDAQTVKVLKEFHPEVYGRLFDMCKPIHSRYNIAITKVLGKWRNAIIVATANVARQCISYLREQQIGTEHFLPLDYLQIIPLKERLRCITEPNNVKLLYDVLQSSTAKINNAILFVSNNTLVCDTSEDASMLAYKFKCNCVALDGTFYHKYGIISGGTVDLSRKAKIWDEAHISELKSKKASVLEEMKKVLTVSQVQSEINTISIEVHALEARLQYAKHDFKEAEAQKVVLEEELNIIQQKVASVCDTITSINTDMSTREKKIQNIEHLVGSIENTIFANFCEETGITTVQHYEKGSLRIYQDQMQKRQDLEEQYNRIQNMLDFEKGRNTENAIVKWRNAIQTAKDKLELARGTEIIDKVAMDLEETKLYDLQCMHDAKKLELNATEGNLGKCRQKVGRIAKLIKEAETELAIIITKQDKKKAEWHTILKNCKVEGIMLPMENPRNISPNTLSDPSSLTTDELYEQEIQLQIDFSRVAQNIQVREYEHVQNVRNQFAMDIIGIQTMLQEMQKPNLKSREKVQATILELNEAKNEFEEARKKANDAKKRFEAVMQNRRNIFVNCLEHIVSQLDFIYKSLTNDQSAQAILVPENPEEPYLNGINYSCIAPGKRFQPLSNFSGGEKTLAALALLFAIHSYRPGPFLVLDEIDAALDSVNIGNVLRFIRRKTDVMQFIIISLRPEMFSHADALIGICSDLEGECPESMLFTLDLTRYSDSRKKKIQ